MGYYRGASEVTDFKGNRELADQDAKAYNRLRDASEKWMYRPSHPEGVHCSGCDGYDDTEQGSQCPGEWEQLAFAMAWGQIGLEMFNRQNLMEEGLAPTEWNSGAEELAK